MKILITGSKGQLATEFIKELSQRDIEFVALSREELDITDFNKVYNIIKQIHPNIVINCSAYNNVDGAESDFIQTYKVNALGSYNLAIACKEINAKLIHYSTDYVFDGTKEGLYTEEDRPNPINEYGKSKLFGELFIEEVLDKYLIFRTSWVYGEGKQNFLYKLTQWAETQQYLKIACDEFSAPTSTKTMVDVTLRAIEKGLTGLWHLTNSGYASRYEWAKEFMRLKGIKKFIYPAYQTDFNLPAKRPKFSAMSNEKLCKELDIEILDWQEALRQFTIGKTNFGG
ncbi:MAG: dTDP-4-dehydrorhamnose reductase [Thermodesulfovibrio sp.]|uniref:dTDP-4-dehydrorhamnose reductase n=1 Tax=unclassified Thermodesulfovibrio TaxID=2645936 RepID=UPI00083B6BAE|nr:MULTISPECIES: dTDP-4-dehydrorhamnose reductase [unclassified Thermodesulfovibrio]MDI1471512.1 dTDP-4-dehydrorhamnose reductase [Thermodesulfovibrio sp. 1176]MDI6715084.1 dTDP-4-dehydrorhamnose reductase [Thermodesulfovibrio sp.]ODA43562.1 dTDP-4-dehydrorhamnose reductase [Thermodesulfovibrio sp. N1]